MRQIRCAINYVWLLIVWNSCVDSNKLKVSDSIEAAKLSPSNLQINTANSAEGSTTSVATEKFRYNEAVKQLQETPEVISGSSNQSFVYSNSLFNFGQSYINPGGNPKSAVIRLPHSTLSDAHYVVFTEMLPYSTGAYKAALAQVSSTGLSGGEFTIYYSTICSSAYILSTQFGPEIRWMVARAGVYKKRQKNGMFNHIIVGIGETDGTNSVRVNLTNLSPLVTDTNIFPEPPVIVAQIQNIPSPDGMLRTYMSAKYETPTVIRFEVKSSTGPVAGLRIGYIVMTPGTYTTNDRNTVMIGKLLTANATKFRIDIPDTPACGSSAVFGSGFRQNGGPSVPVISIDDTNAVNNPNKVRSGRLARSECAGTPLLAESYQLSSIVWYQKYSCSSNDARRMRFHTVKASTIRPPFSGTTLSSTSDKSDYRLVYLGISSVGIVGVIGGGLYCCAQNVGIYTEPAPLPVESSWEPDRPSISSGSKIKEPTISPPIRPGQNVLNPLPRRPQY